MYILLFILIFFICLFGIGLSIIGTILRAIFGIGRPKQHYEQPRHNNGETRNNTNYNNSTSDNEEVHNKKIFSKDEGEYVDFEEIKE